MTDLLVLDIVKKHLKTDQIVLTIGYDIENLTNPKIRNLYDGDVTVDHYGRPTPKHSHGTIRLEHKTSSTKLIMKNVMDLYRKIVNPILLVRRVNVTFCNVVNESFEEKKPIGEQMDLFTDYVELDKKRKQDAVDEKIERKVQRAIIEIQEKYGKNSILKGMNLQEGGTTIQRNGEVGGHKG